MSQKCLLTLIMLRYNIIKKGFLNFNSTWQILEHNHTINFVINNYLEDLNSQEKCLHEYCIGKIINV